jgi:SAM-dependent methyltransferase
LPNLEVRKLDIVKEPVEHYAYDLVFARALLHHLPARFEVIIKLAGAVKPGAFLVLVEPDIHPALSADSPAWRVFWEGFLGWADMKGVDYFIGRKVPTKLRELGFEDVQSHEETIMYNSGSDAAEYYLLFIEEVGSQFVEACSVTQNQIEEVTALLKNLNFWTMNFCFVATCGRKPGR